MRNPFVPADKVEKYVKMLVYGASGSGKTTLALGLSKHVTGKTALIDMERGADFYADSFPFDVLRTKDYKQVMAALDYLESGNSEYSLVVVDPISVLWAVIIEAAQIARGNMERALTFADWGIVKRKMNAVYTRLVNLPMHVVVIARAKDEYEGEGDNRRRAGTTPDAEKNLSYLFDVVISLEKNRKGRKAIVEKDRSNSLPDVIDSPTPDAFVSIFARVTGGTPMPQQTDEEAALSLVNEMVSEGKPPVSPPKPKPAETNGTPRPYAPGVLTEKFNARRGDPAGVRLMNADLFLNNFADVTDSPNDARRFVLAITGKTSLSNLTQQEANALAAMLKDKAAASVEIRDYLAALPVPEAQTEEVLEVTEESTEEGAA